MDNEKSNNIPETTARQVRVENTVSDQEFSQILDAIPDLILVKGTNSKLMWANKAFRTYYGMTNEQLRGIIDAPFVEPDHTQQYVKDDAFVFTTGRVLDIPSEPVTRHDGVVRTFHTVKSPILDTGSEVKMTVGISKDVTDRVQLEQENQYIIEALKIGIWKIDIKSSSVSWDKGMYALFELKREDFSSDLDAWEKTLSAETRAEVQKEVEKALKGEKEFDTTIQLQTSDGRTRFIKVRGVVIRDENGKPIKMYGINIDKTREKETEQSLLLERAKSLQTAKLASLGEMSAGIAHEINNPLAIISGNLSLLATQKMPPAVLAKLEAIERATERISKIVKGLKKFSRSTEKKSYLWLSLAHIVQEVLILTETKSKRTDTNVSCDFRSQARIYCDEVEIEQVLVILINNAVDAVTELREKWVRVSVSEENGFVVLRVTDSGKGIPPKIRDRLFDPFFTTKDVGKGTGLGLSIAKGILDEHNASIALLPNEPNTCFEIRFRIETEHASPASV